jgi:hypothetical protein
MAICELYSYAVPDARGHGQAVSWCRTHDMQVTSRQEPLCPLGRIEQATALAIERIDQQTEQSIRRMMAMQVQLIRQMENQRS